jgi:Holliday junction resolvase RusA-like endonuclease
MLHAIWIPGWHPTPKNKLRAGVNPFVANRLKHADQQTIDMAVLASGAQPASLKRRVDLHLSFPKGQRSCDKDSYWKSCLDALVKSKMLVNDSARWCEPGLVNYYKTHSDSDVWGTMILLEDRP